MKLHLGCGARRIDGFVHVDVASYPHVDIVHEIDDLPMIDSNSVELIYSSHTLEHLPRARTVGALREWLRVLRPGGTLRIAVPDFTALAELYVLMAGRSDTVRDRFGNPMSFALAAVAGSVIGGQTGRYDFHQAIFDYESLRLQLERAGFQEVRRYDWRKTEHAHVDDYSQAYFPHMDRDRGFPLSLNVEATKP